MSLVAFAISAITVAAPQTSPAQWTLVEDVRIGGVDGAQALTHVSAVAVDHDGHVYATQPLDGVIRVFDRDGSQLPTLGRRGDGPGEFRTPLSLGLLGDTVWVNDVTARRITLWRDRILVGGFRFETPELGADYGPPSLAAVLSDGSLLVAAAPRLGTEGNRAGSHGVAVRQKRDGTGRTPIASLYPSNRLSIAGPSGSRLFISYRPFDDGALLRISPDGEIIVVVDRRPASSGRPATYSVLALKADGDTISLTQVPYQPKRLTAEIIDRVLDVPAPIVQRFASEAAARRAVREAINSPDYQPPVTDLVVGSDHMIWLRREDTGAPTTEWQVLDASGRVSANVAVPRTATVVHVEAGRIWAVLLDSLDVPYIVRYRISR